MNARFRAVATAACVLAALGCQPPSPSAVSSPPGDPEAVVVAEVEGVPITRSELDAWVKDELFAQQARGGPGKLYELRASALERMIGQRVVELAAQSRGVAEEQVVEEAADALGPVSDEEVQSFYEENKAQLRGAGLEEMSDQIRAFLESRRETEALDALLEQADVVVHLEAPRFDIAADGPARGPEDARVTIVEFSDFQCPYCRRADEVVKQVLDKYPEDVRVVYRHLPLDNIHPRARPAAEAAACAADQDRFWAYHDQLFENQRELSDENLKRIAEEVGLDLETFEACLAEGRHREKIEADVTAAREAGVTGTPAFFVNGRLLSGARPAEAFYEIIEAELRTGAETGSESSG